MGDNGKRGPGRPATVVPGAADIIRRERANGASWAAIAHTLNGAGTEKPTGGEWSASAAASYARVHDLGIIGHLPNDWWPDGEGARLRREREAIGSQVWELAAYAGVTRATVWNVESGRTVPRRETAEALWSALHTLRKVCDMG